MTDAATLIDGYKVGHVFQYPAKTEYVYSNWTPRDSRNDQKDVVFFGLQAFLKKYIGDVWQREFFDRPKEEVLAAYKRRMDGYLGPDSVTTDHIAALHDLGYIPLQFKALPEGSLVPIRVPMFTIENTHPDFAWVTNYFETLLSAEMWLPCTSATTAFRLRQILEEYAERTGSPIEFVDWQGHDFSMRGMGGLEAAQLSGAGHLVFFTGTDTIPAIDFVEDYYFGRDTFVAGSVPATEHSVMCAGGNESEIETFRRILGIYPGGIVSIVSDTWDLWKVLTNYIPELREIIVAREGKLVVRPDSGDPVKIVCGDPDAPEGSPARKGVVELLWDEFGGTETEKGYKIIDSHLGVIYGDGINFTRMRAILDGLEKKGFASANMVFGVGSYTYQNVTRDEYGFAMKSTWVQIDGVGTPIFKDPVTDSGIKKSLRGRIAVIDVNENTVGARPLYKALDEQTEEHEDDRLELVWKNGKFAQQRTFENIRALARQWL